MTCLRFIGAAMTGEVAYCFEQDLYYDADPQELAARNVALLLNHTRCLSSLCVWNVDRCVQLNGVCVCIRVEWWL